MSERRANDAVPRRGRRRTFIPERPHFISIIVTEDDKNLRLKIPKDYLERYQIFLTDGVVLKMPSRAVWRIGIVTDSGGDIWMVSGWRKFTKYYSIHCGQFLMFRYDGDSRFSVTIVDNNTGMEIDYPARDRVPRNVDPRLDVNQDVGQEPNADQEQEDHPIPQGNMQPNTNEGQEVGPIIPEEEEEEEEEMLPIPFLVEAKALDRVSNFHSDYPYFVLFIHPNHVSGKYILFLPAYFSKLYFSKVPASIKLKNYDNKIWSFSCRGKRPSRLSIRWDSFARDNQLEAGDVCVFELMERSEIPLLRVFISPAREDKRADKAGGDKLAAEEKQKSKITTTDNVTALEQAVAFKSQYPTFLVVMESAYLTTLGLLVPADFEEAYFSKSLMIKLSVPDGRAWFLNHSGDTCYLSLSWFSFVEDNNLHTGDVCVFELIERGSIPQLNVNVFPGDNKEKSKQNAPATKGNEKKVTVQGGNKDESKRNALEMNETPARKVNEKKITVEADNKEISKRSTLTETPATKGKEKKVIVEVDSTTKSSASGTGKRKIWEMSEKEKKELAYERASTYRSPYPFFVMHMRKTYLSCQYNLILPAGFAREHFSVIMPTRANLCLPDGRLWQAKWICYGKTQGKHGFTWDTFALNNDLQEDDACVFELMNMDGSDPLLRVTIFRRSDYDGQQPPPPPPQQPYPVRPRIDNEPHPPPPPPPQPSTVRLRTDNGRQPPPRPPSSVRTVNGRPPPSSSVRLCTLNERQPPPTIVRPCTSLETTCLERARAFRSNQPFFTITVNSSYLFGGYGLYVPLPFSRQFFNKEVKSVMLQVRGGGPDTWNVNCSHISTREGVVYLGWRQFAVDNGMKLGDICVFELIDHINRVFEVVIFRAGAN